MTEEPKKAGEPAKPPSWWLTLPGLLTAAATLLTAITGLLLGLQKIGWIGGSGTPAADSSSPVAASSAPTGSPSAASSKPTVSAVRPSLRTPTRIFTRQSGYEVGVPVGRSYRSGDIAYSVLGASAAPGTDGKLRLSFQVKAVNKGAYDMNFWDRSFRVIAGGDSYAPVSGLNEIVRGESFGTGEVEFLVPDDTTTAQLKVNFPDATQTIPFTISRS